MEGGNIGMEAKLLLLLENGGMFLLNAATDSELGRK